MKPRIAVFVHQPKCSIQSVNGMMKALSSHYEFKVFTRQEVEDIFFDDVDIVAFPGGVGDSETYSYLLKDNENKVKNFVKNGGKYLGICMGAYWAGSGYFNIVGSTEIGQYIRRPNTDTKRPHAKNMPVTWNGNKEHMYFFDGCSIVQHKDSFKVIATYANDDPMAVIQNNIGLIGCHPESQPYWYTLHSWMKNKYHNGYHHELLLDFVNDLHKGKS